MSNIYDGKKSTRPRFNVKDLSKSRQSKIVIDEHGCWIWQGGINNSGYGVHRAVYTLLAGEIPDGLQLDHLCRVRRCCNPEHLEPVTARVNVLRGDSFCADEAKRTHCPQGHPYDAENTYLDVKNNQRQCHICRKVHSRASSKKLTDRFSETGVVIPPKESHCKLGHEIAGDNLRVTATGRSLCRTCNNAKALAYYYKKRDQ